MKDNSNSNSANLAIEALRRHANDIKLSEIRDEKIFGDLINSGFNAGHHSTRTVFPSHQITT